MYPDFCQTCDQKATDQNVTLARCSRCRVVNYCSITCQKADWKAGHRQQCPKLVAEMDKEPTNDMNLPQPIWEMMKSKAQRKKIVPLPKRDPNVTYTREDVDDIIEETMTKQAHAEGRRVIASFGFPSRARARARPSSSGASPSASSGLPSLFNRPRVPSPPVGLLAGIFKPFHRLDDETWLHGRAEEDVYRILIDVYRSRIKDQHDGESGDETASPVPQDPVENFKTFLKLFNDNNKRALLPDWWTAEKAEECVKFALKDDDAWISLVRLPTRYEIIKHYDDQRFGVQLRVFGEQLYGGPPAGKKDGMWMADTMKMIESAGIESNVVTEI